MGQDVSVLNCAFRDVLNLRFRRARAREPEGVGLGTFTVVVGIGVSNDLSAAQEECGVMGQRGSV